jgi:hypothetical protein
MIRQLYAMCSYFGSPKSCLDSRQGPKAAAQGNFRLGFPYTMIGGPTYVLSKMCHSECIGSRLLPAVRAGTLDCATCS